MGGEKNETIIVSKDNYNYGIALLRIWMCFEVVLFHFKTWADISRDSAHNLPGIIRYVFWYCKDIAVPVFMMLAFMFTDVAALAFNKEKLKKRFYRLIVPVLFWAVIYYVVIILIDFVHKTHMVNGITDLLWQILAGHVYNKTLWFQSLLIFISAFFVLIHRLFKPKTGMYICSFIGIICLFFQYSGITIDLKQSLFPDTVLGGPFDKSYVINTFGRLFEMIPYASVGIILSKYYSNKELQNKTTFLPYYMILIVFFLSYPVFLSIDGFYYQGVEKIIVAILFVLLFSNQLSFPIPVLIKKIIKIISRHVMSIYYMHRLIGLVLYNTPISRILRMQNGSLYDCVLIFSISLLFGILGSKIPIRPIKESFS